MLDIPERRSLSDTEVQTRVEPRGYVLTHPSDRHTPSYRHFVPIATGSWGSERRAWESSRGGTVHTVEIEHFHSILEV